MATTKQTSRADRRSVWQSWLMVVLAFWIVAILGGCDNQNRGSVTGTVTLDGEPLPKATVEFQPETGSPSFGETDAKGKYELKYSADKVGAEIGSHTVVISTFYIKSEGDKRIPMPEKVPAKYSNDEPLIREVKPGRQVIDFALTTDD